MKETNRMEYYSLLEQLLGEINRAQNVDEDKVNDILAELCRVLRVAKGVLEFSILKIMKKLVKAKYT